MVTLANAKVYMRLVHMCRHSKYLSNRHLGQRGSWDAVVQAPQRPPYPCRCLPPPPNHDPTANARKKVPGRQQLPSIIPTAVTDPPLLPTIPTSPTHCLSPCLPRNCSTPRPNPGCVGGPFFGRIFGANLFAAEGRSSQGQHQRGRRSSRCPQVQPRPPGHVKDVRSSRLYYPLHVPG